MTESGYLLDAPLADGRNASRRVRELVSLHADFVWRSARRMGVPEAAADDATQQVFLVAARRIDEIEPGRERSFLYRTAMNVAAHVRRSLGRRREVSAEPSHDTVDPAPQPDHALDEHRARVLLDRVLEELDLDLREVFVLYELEELAVPEIAELLGIPGGTVSSRLRRAREAFHKAAARLRAQQSHEATRNAALAAKVMP